MENVGQLEIVFWLTGKINALMAEIGLRFHFL